MDFLCEITIDVLSFDILYELYHPVLVKICLAT